MKKYISKFLFISYVAVAILASGLVKAEDFGSNQAGVVIDNLEATFNQSSFEFMVSGVSATECSSRVVLAEQMDHQIVFKIISASPMNQICIQRISKFVETIPVRQMVQVSKLLIEPQDIYTLSVEGSPISIEVSGSELLAY